MVHLLVDGALGSVTEGAIGRGVPVQPVVEIGDHNVLLVKGEGRAATKTRVNVSGR